MSETPLEPGQWIGILGGGQLGRMLAVVASRLGLNVHVFEPGADCPASAVAARTTTAPYEDGAALDAFARSVDVVTYEFENVPAAALDAIEAIRPIRPGRRALATSQDRLTEKSFLQELGLATAPFAAVDSDAGLDAAVSGIGLPAILKTRTLGYDGKGQVRLTGPDHVMGARAALGHAPAILEGFVEFSAEVSVIGARGIDGAVACFDPGENVHKGGILATTTVPARLSNAQRTDAILLTARIMTALDYVGVIGVELFVSPRGLIVNEFAPRVHNSGHWTQDGCLIDQFEQHVRAVAGWPLGDGRRHSNVVMENLIGDDVARVADLRSEPLAIHLYGKAEVKPGRKMGHVNRITGPAG